MLNTETCVKVLKGWAFWNGLWRISICSIGTWKLSFPGMGPERWFRPTDSAWSWEILNKEGGKEPEFFFLGPASLVMRWHFQELLLSTYSSQDIFHSNSVCYWTSPTEFSAWENTNKQNSFCWKRASHGIISMTEHFIIDPPLQVPDTLHCWFVTM
jgi:hypothetical protein